MKPARAIADALTLSRALLAPAILIVLIRGAHGGAGAALLLTAVALATDYLDGAIARRYAVESRFGKVADAATDALVFVAVFTGLAVRGVLPFWLPAVIAAREAAMHAVVRPALLRARIDAGARPAGKLKTVLQATVAVVVLGLLLLAPDVAGAAAAPLAAAAAVVSIVSLYWYVAPLASRRGVDRLTASIVATCLSLWVLQVAVVAVAAEGGAPGAAWCALVHTGVAGGLAALLLACRRHFVIVGGGGAGARLPQVNPSNVLTLARLTSIPTVVFLVTAAARRAVPAWPVLIVLAVVLLTDLADGALARRRQQVTRIGSWLDSSTDYLLLGAAAILALAHGIGTPWVFAVLIGRLAVQAAAVLWITAAGRPLPAATPLGKVSIAAGMVLLAAELAAALGERALPAAGFAPLAHVLAQVGLAGVLVASAVEKAALLVRAVRR